MVQIETTLGYGFHVSREQAVAMKYGPDGFIMRPMCRTCGQSPYFFGLVIRVINSKQAYIEFDLTDDDVKNLKTKIAYDLDIQYEKSFGRKPPFEPTFMMFTDMKVV